MTATTKPRFSIRGIASEAPEKALYAAIIERAVLDARDGDAEALAWLSGPACLHLLIGFVPDDTDPRIVQHHLIEQIGDSL